jgi:hypothetical protein
MKDNGDITYFIKDNYELDASDLSTLNAAGYTHFRIVQELYYTTSDEFASGEYYQDPGGGISYYFKTPITLVPTQTCQTSYQSFTPDVPYQGNKEIELILEVQITGTDGYVGTYLRTDLCPEVLVNHSTITADSQGAEIVRIPYKASAEWKNSYVGTDASIQIRLIGYKTSRRSY